MATYWSWLLIDLLVLYQFVLKDMAVKCRAKTLVCHVIIRLIAFFCLFFRYHKGRTFHHIISRFIQTICKISDNEIFSNVVFFLFIHSQNLLLNKTEWKICIKNYNTHSLVSNKVIIVGFHYINVILSIRCSLEFRNDYLKWIRSEVRKLHNKDKAINYKWLNLTK